MEFSAVKLFFGLENSIGNTFLILQHFLLYFFFVFFFFSFRPFVFLAVKEPLIFKAICKHSMSQALCELNTAVGLLYFRFVCVCVCKTFERVMNRCECKVSQNTCTKSAINSKSTRNIEHFGKAFNVTGRLQCWTNHCNPKIGTFQNSARSPYHFAHQKYKYGNFLLIIAHLNLMSFTFSIRSHRKRVQIHIHKPKWRYTVKRNNKKRFIFLLHKGQSI